MKTTKINLNLYKTFLEVYETRNLSNAAHNLCLTQPTISYNIKELEKQLKIRLFNSNSRGVDPTRTADELYPLIHASFSYLITAENTIEEFNEKSNGVIHLGLSLYFTAQIVSSFIAAFKKNYPNIKFEIKTSPIDQAIDILGKNESDLVIFAYIPVQNETSPFDTIRLCELENSLYASPEFLKANNLDTKITKAQIEKLPILSQPQTYQARTELERVGISRNPTVEANTTEMIVSLAEKGLGLALGPTEFMPKETKLVRLEVVDIKLPRCILAIRYNKNLANKAASAFIESIKKNFSN
jgi:DNA-binding transcriptional LysR family regulator